MELLTRNNFEGWMQKLMERLDRQDELLLAMKAEGKTAYYHGKHPPFRQSGFVHAAPDKQAHTANATAVSAHCPTRHWARKPITARRMC
jgi:hypothetical protein